MAITIFDSLGHKVSSSANLRGIVRHAGKVGVNVVRLRVASEPLKPHPVWFYFHGGDNATAYFADWRVLLDWLATPNRAPTRLTLPSAIYGEAYKADLLKPLQKLGTQVTTAD